MILRMHRGWMYLGFMGNSSSGHGLTTALLSWYPGPIPVDPPPQHLQPQQPHHSRVAWQQALQPQSGLHHHFTPGPHTPSPHHPSHHHCHHQQQQPPKNTSSPPLLHPHRHQQQQHQSYAAAAAASAASGGTYQVHVCQTLQQGQAPRQRPGFEEKQTARLTAASFRDPQEVAQASAQASVGAASSAAAALRAPHAHPAASAAIAYGAAASASAAVDAKEAAAAAAAASSKPPLPPASAAAGRKEREPRSPLIDMTACALAHIFSRPCHANTKLPPPSEITVFHSVRAPDVAVSLYFSRLLEHLRISGEACVLALALLERLVGRNPGMPVDALTVHRLLLTLLMVSSKFFDDSIYLNKDWAGIGGVLIGELNTLERELLILLDHNLYVSEQEYYRVLRDLCNPALHACTSNSVCRSVQHSLSCGAIHEEMVAVMGDAAEILLSTSDGSSGGNKGGGRRGLIAAGSSNNLGAHSRNNTPVNPGSRGSSPIVDMDSTPDAVAH